MRTAAAARGASDIHLRAGRVPLVRINGNELLRMFESEPDTGDVRADLRPEQKADVIRARGGTPLDPLAIAKNYLGLIADRRFVVPAATVSLIMGGLFSIFSAAPRILIEAMHFTPIQLGLFFAGTVLIVFAAGITTGCSAAPARLRSMPPTRHAGGSGWSG